MAEELLEALVAVGLELVVGLLIPILKGLAAVGADEALGVELAAGEGGDDAAADALPADAALVFHAVVVVVHPHLLEEGAPVEGRYSVLFSDSSNLNDVCCAICR